MELRLQKGSIKATIQKVHDMLGIPIGKRKLEDLEQRPSNDPFNTEWEAEYGHLGRQDMGFLIQWNLHKDYSSNYILKTVLEAAFAPLNKSSEAAEDDRPSATNGAGSLVPVTSLHTISNNIL
ncbi:hypothetical protein Tco_0676677 [Tanacetum coccineum]